MDNDILYIVFAVAVLLFAFALVRRFAGCLIKTVVMVVVAAVLAFVYFNYIKEYDSEQDKPEIVRKADQQLKKQINDLQRNR